MNAHVFFVAIGHDRNFPAFLELDNFKPVNKMVEVLNKPYNRQDNIIDYQTVTDEDKKEYKTFCGT